MNARDKMLAHLETSKPTSSSEFHALTRAPKSRVNQILKELLESGHIEIDSQVNDIKRYRLRACIATAARRFLTTLMMVEKGPQAISQQLPAYACQ